MSERRSSAKSKKKRPTQKASTPANKHVQSREDESMVNDDDEELDATDYSEDNEDVESLSEEEAQVLGDLKTLETVLSELINRRKHGSMVLSADTLTPSSESSSAASDVTRIDSGEWRQTDAEEEQLVQEDVDRLDRFLDQMHDQRTHGKKTPPGRPTITAPPDPANSAASIIKYEHLKDKRLSHIVSIDDEITREMNKVHAELRKAKTKSRSSRKTGTAAADTRHTRHASSSLASSSSLSSRSTSTTGEVTGVGGGQHGGEPADSSQGEEASWFSFDGFNVPSETSSVQTLPPSDSELMVQYNQDFLTDSPSGAEFDPFIRKTIQRILDLKTTFPDENLYLIPSSSLPADELPHLSSLFEVATVPHTKSQMLQEPSHSSIPPGKMSSHGVNKRASVEIDTLSEGARVKRELGDLTGKTLVDYLGGSQATLETDDVKAGLPNNPSEARISVKENIARNDNSVVPEKEREQKARSVSPPAPRRESTSPARATLPSVLSSTISPRSGAAKDVEALPDHQPGVNPTQIPRQPESPDAAALKSSLRSASATQSTMKQNPPAVLPSAKIEPVELSTNVSSLVKKKVSFADMNSTMYILVNPSSEVLDTTGKSSRESVGSQTGCCMSDIGVAHATPAHHHRSGLGAKARDSLSLNACDCTNSPRLSTSTPTSPTRSSGLVSCCYEEAHHPSAEALADLATPCHAITGSITHVICRARSSAEQGRALCGSRDKWVTRVNSRSLSFPTDDVAVCPSCGSESFHSTTSECISLHAPCPPSASDVTAVRRPQASCSHCPMTNRNYSCSQSRHGEEESDSLQASVSDHTSTGSCLEGTPDEGGGGGGGGGPTSSSASCNIAASESRNNDVCSTVSVVFNIRDRNRTRNKISEK